MASNVDIKVPKFKCVPCDFVCNKKCLWERHCETRKHEMLQNVDIWKVPEKLYNYEKKYDDNQCGTYAQHFTDETDNEKHPLSDSKSDSKSTKNNKVICSECGKYYSCRQSLSVHKKKCGLNPKETNDKDVEFKDLLMKVMTQNMQITESLVEICKQGTHNTNHSNNTNNTNNIQNNNKTFNLQFFLNETCKDAMNIQEFVESVQISLQDLENVGSLGYVEGISKILLKNLNNLDVKKRPIHCSDLKREVIHIKANNVWEREEEAKPNMVQAIKQISHKNIRTLQAWKQENPHYRDGESKLNDKYLKIVNESMGACEKEQDEKNYQKIIHRVAHETKIEKE